MHAHRAIEYVVTDEDSPRRECRVCGRDLIGHGENLRHYGEDVPAVAPVERADAEVFGRAIEVGAAALDRVGISASPEQVSRAVVAALYGDGLLRRRRKVDASH